LTAPLGDRRAMLRDLAPRLRPGLWACHQVAEADPDRLRPRAAAMVREAEGVTLVLPAGAGAGRVGPAMGWIELGVHSALDGVGLTAAVAGALAAEGSACNVLAAARQDQLLLPAPDAPRALAALASCAAAAG
jgi:hypothetical protein